MFDKFGPVEEVTVLRDDQGVSRGETNTTRGEGGDFHLKLKFG